MKYAVDYARGSVEFELDPERVLGHHRTPAAVSADSLHTQAIALFEDATEGLSLSQVVVPGDTVVLVSDSALPGVLEILRAASDVLFKAEVGSVTWLVSEDVPRDPSPTGRAVLVRHDAESHPELAYLATTRSEHRIYLNRLLTDADCVIPVGSLCYVAGGVIQGPWSSIYPAFGDVAPSEASPSERPEAPPATAEECAEVAWLLGTVYQVGLVPGRGGVAEVLAGLSDRIKSEGERLVRQYYDVAADEEAEVVVVGVGNAQGATDWSDLLAALENASKLVQRAGKIVALTDLDQSSTPALDILRHGLSPRETRDAIKRAETTESDRTLAGRLAEVLDWADVYVSGFANPGLAEDLGMIRLDKPADANKLVARAARVYLISSADSCRVTTRDRV